MTMQEKYVGKKFGKLTILEITKKDVPNIQAGCKFLAKCICECGNEKIIALAVLRREGRNGKPHGCGCQMYQYKKGKESYLYKGCGDLPGRKWSGLQANAKLRNIEFKITIGYAWQQFLNQNEKCNYSGEKLYFRRTSYDYAYDTASLDRINPLLGYIEGNIQWIHKKINEIKWDLGEEKFLYLCYLLTNPILHKIDEINGSCIITPKGNGFNGVGNLVGVYWNRINKNAEKRNILLSITKENAWDMFLQQRGFCKLTGLPISFSDHTASLDRIDSNKNYTIDNIQWIHKDINYKLKKHYSEEELKNICEKIYNNLNLKEKYENKKIDK